MKKHTRDEIYLYCNNLYFQGMTKGSYKKWVKELKDRFNEDFVPNEVMFKSKAYEGALYSRLTEEQRKMLPPLSQFQLEDYNKYKDTWEPVDFYFHNMKWWYVPDNQ